MIIIDLDNCLADDRWRRHLLPPPGATEAHLWHPYHEGLINDPVHHQEFWEEDAIVFTARPERYRFETRLWLNRHSLITPYLYMRPHGNVRHSVDLKRWMLLALPRGIRTLVTVAYDDRMDVVTMYREEGIEAEYLSIDKGGDYHQ